jgi:hypothetical protein
MQLPQLPSLNRAEVRALSSRNQFFPYELTGEHKEAVLGFRYNPPCKENQNRASFRARVKIIDSTNSNAVGRTYTLNFKVGRSGEQQDYSDRDRLGFVAACVGQKQDDPDFDADAAQQTLVDLDEDGGFDSEECKIFHTRTSKIKEVAAKKNGQAVLEDRAYANDYFAPVG